MSSAGPRVVPQDPQFATTSEREVWERLRAQGSEDWILLANVRLTDERKDHELDLVVLMPDVAIVVLEVKGGSVSIENDAWFTHTGDQRREIHPVDQAREGKYALRAYIEKDPRWKHSSRTRVRFGVVEAINGNIRMLINRGRGYKNMRYLLLKAKRMAVTNTEYVAFQKIRKAA